MPEPLAPDLRDLLALHLVDGLGPQRITALLERFGSATKARHASASELRTISGIGDQLAANLAASLPKVELDAEVARLTNAGVDLLALGRPGYPPTLATIPAAPHLLFKKGTIDEEDARAVAIVGTRHADGYGKKVAKQLAEGLARAGVTIVSGLARGIDSIAHRGALDVGGRTLAVLANGLSSIYPPEHAGLAEMVCASGALLTEATMLAEPTRWRFPARNRIISGLSRVVVIVQAPADSGALLTAEHAAEQGRTVMAVPGSIEGDRHAGCHRLIRDGAALCRGIEDILEELDGVSAVAAKAVERKKEKSDPPTPASPPPELDGVQRQVWDYLGDGPRAGDEIARQVGLAVPQLASVLMLLEMNRVVRRLPGNRYERA